MLDRLNFNLMMTLQLCGVQCPSIGRRGGKEPDTEAVPPQPFALEARHFSEMAVLNREVRILLQGVDKHDNLIGSVVYSSSDGPDAKPLDLGKELLDRGLAKASLLFQSLPGLSCPQKCLLIGLMIAILLL